LMKHLREVAPRNNFPWILRVTEEALQAIADEGRLHDTMILDFLVQLATQTRSEVIRTRGLKDLVREYLGYHMPKDEFRTDFAQIEGRDWNEVDRGYFDYAMRDPVGTYEVYRLLASRARVEAGRFPRESTYPAAGVLTESLQVRGDLALAEAGRAGMAIDRDY